MDQRVLFQHSELRHLQVPGVCGLVIMNPPYGQRLSNPRALNDLFHHIGAQLKRAFSGWRVGILIPDLRLVKALDLPLEDLGSFQNGGLRVWLMGGRIPAE